MLYEITILVIKRVTSLPMSLDPSDDLNLNFVSTVEQAFW